MIGTLVVMSLLAAPPPRPMIVLTYNVRYANPDDGPNVWEARKGRLIEQMKKSGADVIAVQEALHPQMVDLRAELKDFDSVGVGRDDGKEQGEYAAIFFRKRRFKLMDTGTFWFSDTPEEPGSRTWGNHVTRICTWASLDDTTAKRRFDLYNVHLDHESQPSRAKSVDLLISRLTLREDKHPSLITGDFNAGPESPEVRNLMGKVQRGNRSDDQTLWWPYWSDAFAEAANKPAEAPTYNGFGRATGGSRIDYVFMSPDWQSLEGSILKEEQNGRYPSDHFPVRVKIQLAE